MRLHPRHRIDIGAADVAFAAMAVLRRGNRERAASAVEDAWSPEGGALACLSARSAFDLVLGALDLPRGGEILVSAVTIGEMAQIIRHHGLVPVPVDLDPATLAPRTDLLERLRGERTVAVLVAHLFGGRVDMGPVAAFAGRHGLPLIEDCAQAFTGRGDTGHPSAVVSLFSFGPIKTSTAVGGGLVRVRNAALLARMRALHRAWPVQGRGQFARRVARMGALVALQRPLPYGMLAACCGRTLDEVVRRSSRSLPAGAGFRRRPSAPLLVLLRHRLETDGGRRLAARAARGEEFSRALAPVLELPGAATTGRTHWLFPVTVEDPRALVDRLRAAGFDASGATSALVALPAPTGRPEADPAVARQMLERTVFLPVYPELPEAQLRRLLDVLLRPTAATSSH